MTTAGDSAASSPSPTADSERLALERRKFRAEVELIEAHRDRTREEQQRTHIGHILDVVGQWRDDVVADRLLYFALTLFGIGDGLFLYLRPSGANTCDLLPPTIAWGASLILFGFGFYRMASREKKRMKFFEEQAIEASEQLLGHRQPTQARAQTSEARTSPGPFRGQRPPEEGVAAAEQTGPRVPERP